MSVGELLIYILLIEHRSYWSFLLWNYVFALCRFNLGSSLWIKIGEVAQYYFNLNMWNVFEKANIKTREVLGLLVSNYPAYKETKTSADSVINLDSLVIRWSFSFSNKNNWHWKRKIRVSFSFGLLQNTGQITQAVLLNLAFNTVRWFFFFFKLRCFDFGYSSCMRWLWFIVSFRSLCKLSRAAIWVPSQLPWFSFLCSPESFPP